MAFNHQPENFFAYTQTQTDVTSQNERTAEAPFKKSNSLHFRKKSLSESRFRKTSNHSLLPEVIPKREQAIEKSFISDAKMYALKKRLLLPSWLLEGVLLGLGTKEPWFESLALSRMGKIVACPNHINVKILIPFFLIWNELVSRIFQQNTREITSVKLQINKFITGTKTDIQNLAKEIEHVFSSPLKLFEVKLSKRTKGVTMSKKGSLNFIRHAQLENDVDGVWMTLSLSHGFQEICSPCELKIENQIDKQQIVTISPTVVQSMGYRTPLKKILNYLFLEFSKQEARPNQCHWNSFRIDCKKINHFHKDFLSTAPSLYDHGILGWNNSPPSKKISELKQESALTHHKHEILCAWQLSQQIRDAFEFEQMMSKKALEQQYEPVNHAPSLSFSLPHPKNKPDIHPISTREKHNHTIFEQDNHRKKEEHVQERPWKKQGEHPLETSSRTINRFEMDNINSERNRTRAAQSNSLFPEPPIDELKLIREEKKIKKEEEVESKPRPADRQSIFTQKNIHEKNPKPPVMKQTLFDDGILIKKRTTIQPNPSLEKPKIYGTSPKERDLHQKSEMTDTEFLVRVSEFYESLKPIQKRAFERDRKGMSSEQFRAYMSSILQRRKAPPL
jgi:hypothetical protein